MKSSIRRTLPDLSSTMSSLRTGKYRNAICARIVMDEVHDNA
jgi:hypothetical protein